LPCSALIAVCVWLKEKKHKTKQHLPVTTGSPCLSPQEDLSTHRGCPCPIVLMERSLPSWPDQVTALLAVTACWVWVGAILPVLESVGNSSSQMTSQEESGQGCAVLCSNGRVILAEREEAPNGPASLCEHGQPLPLRPRVSSDSPRLSLFPHPHGERPAFCLFWLKERKHQTK